MNKIEYIGKCLVVKTEGKKILVVGDLHLGYEEYLNQAGVFVSRQMFNEMIEEFDEILNKFGEVDEVVLLGDVKHDFGSVMWQERRDALGVFDYFEDKKIKIIIVKGNHDNLLGSVVAGRGIEVRDFYIIDEFCFAHGNRDFPEMHDKTIRCWVLGHGHPAIKLSDMVKVEKYKCFLEGEYERKKVVIVPSFLAYSEGSDPRENNLGLAWDFNFNKFKVRVVGEGLSVLDFGLLKNLT
ncbi:MAG: metallophosphoesterase [Nanoarchaeota archaeon]|nr:metallophosphoesterase [Nanoarchaeota archaeon]